MKHNFPNYLNPHNIDPGRIEPAHIDQAPGNDSVRPGQKIGTVGLVGRGHPKLQPLIMTNAEAIEVLKHIETDIYGRIAIRKVIDALRGPWVRTADRLPEERETRNGCVLIIDERGYGSVQKRQVLERYPRDYPWWMPIPPLPEEVRT